MSALSTVFKSATNGLYRGYWVYWENGVVYYWQLQKRLLMDALLDQQTYHAEIEHRFGIRQDDRARYIPSASWSAAAREAERRLPNEVHDAMTMRAKRASDLMMKKTYLPYDMQILQTPQEHYLRDQYLQVVHEWRERYAHNCFEYADFPRRDH